MKIKFFVTLQCVLKILKYKNQKSDKKSDKPSFIIYADLECVIEKINGGKINERYVDRRKDCVKTFREYLREYPMKIINFKKKN